MPLTTWSRTGTRTGARVVLGLLMLTAAGALQARAAAPAPLVYTLSFPAPDAHVANVEIAVPTDGRASVELFMPVWSPGYYGVADYAHNVQEFAAHAPHGDALVVDRPQPNHWRIQTGRAATITVSYRLLCQGRSVTGSWVDPSYAIINGPSTYMTLVDTTARPHEVRLVLPPVWAQAVTSLDPAPGGRPNDFIAPNYDVLADSPIVMGTIREHEFRVNRTTLTLADFGDLGAWDGALAAADLQRIVAEHDRFIGGLPFRHYVFLNAFRRGAGGLEHLNSSLLSSGPNPPTRGPTLRWLEYVSHEFFHSINVKRLRPVELGPFDYEHVPQTPSLWISEGLTTYYGDLAVERSGVSAPADFLDDMSSQIRQLQTSPGRLVQTLSQASLDVGKGGSASGIGNDPKTTVSYYIKGVVVGLVLDAKVRHATSGRVSLDDVMRAEYAHYSGAHGFTPEEFQRMAAQVAGADLTPFFHAALDTTDELDYTEMLDWYGLRFADPTSTDPAKAWTLEPRPDATAAQKAHLAALMAPTPARR